MNEIKRMKLALEKAQGTLTNIYNYTIPQAWDTFGYEKGIRLRNHEMIVDPYDFYSFALSCIEKMIKKPTKMKQNHGNWLLKQVIYDLDLTSLSTWDHDRSDRLDDQNLYGLRDTGTFLKAVILLPLLKRAGVTTLLVHQLLELDEKRTHHDFGDPHAIKHHLQIKEALADPMLEGMTAKEQFQLFIAIAHQLGFYVMCDFPSARVGRNNAYLIEHPEWFYWIKASALATYHAPKAQGLPIGCIPSKNACKVLYQSEEVKEHLSIFVYDPKTADMQSYEAFQAQPHTNALKDIEQAFHCTTAPTFSDQINADLNINIETTLLRFYEDQPVKQAPYLLQDTLRPDLFPYKKPCDEVWSLLKDTVLYTCDEFKIDGFYINEPWYYPHKLLKEAIALVRKKHPNTAFLLEDSDEANAAVWKKMGVNLITGPSSYFIHDVMNHNYHTFAYTRNHATLPVLGASELRDTPRITQYEQGEALAKLLTYMNLFLPNVVPYIASGQLSLEKQPQCLSPFCDSSFQNAYAKDDPRAYRQSMLDRTYYNYTRSDYHIFLQQIEQFMNIRQQYLPAIMNREACIPVWFDSPTDSGIGFTYTLQDQALLVVCNTNIYQEVSLTIHTENMLWELPFDWKKIKQICSSHDPYIYDITLNEFQNIPLTFAAGEVKLLEITTE